MTFGGFNGLAPRHEAFAHLAEHCIDPAQRTDTCRVVKECMLLGTHEGVDLDILLPVALFHKSNKPIEEHLHFVQNILESIEFYTDKKIHQVIDAIQQNLENNYTSYGAEHIMQKYTSHVSLILHDAIILASLENLGTDTAKNLVNKKAGLFRIIAQEARKKLLLR